LEQLNIVGKRSGDSGFVAHKATLVNALSRVLADRIMVGDFTVGRKGFLGYVKALAGSNIIRVIPANGDASVSHGSGKRLKVTCGSNTSYLEDLAWVGEKTPLTLCEVRVSSKRIVKGIIDFAQPNRKNPLKKQVLVSDYVEIRYMDKKWRKLSVDTHGQSPWHFTGQASLDLNPGPPAISHTQ
jgi:hypothetical protein